MKTGRNEPCPCGSGKKYKHCCGVAGAQAPANAAAEFNAQLLELIGERQFHSMEELQAFVQEAATRRNSSPLNEFHGLSPEAMHRFLDFPWDSPQLAQFHRPSDAAAAEAPLPYYFGILAKAAAEKGIKATATGYLPRNLCREAFAARPSGPILLLKEGPEKLMREDDFPDLHITRVVAETAGLLKRAKGVFSLTAKGQKLQGQHGALYEELVRAYTTQYNWAYGGGWQPIPFIQKAFLFSLYLLAKHGNQWRPASFYADAFLNAFPAVTAEVEPTYWPPEKEVAYAYTHRTLSQFAVRFGFVESRESGGPQIESLEVRATPLLAEVFHFAALKNPQAY